MPNPTSTDIAVIPVSKPLNNAQKKLAEKAVRNRFDSLTNQVKRIQTNVHRRVKTLHPITLYFTNYHAVELAYQRPEVPRWSPESRKLLTKLKKVQKLYKAHKTRQVKEERELAKKHEAETEAFQKEYENYAKRIQADIDKKNTALNKELEYAEEVRSLALTTLDEALEQALLHIHFNGESHDMMQYLNSLPGPEVITEGFKKKGIKLTESLTVPNLLE